MAIFDCLNGKSFGSIDSQFKWAFMGTFRPIMNGTGQDELVKDKSVDSGGLIDASVTKR